MDVRSLVPVLLLVSLVAVAPVAGVSAGVGAGSAVASDAATAAADVDAAAVGNVTVELTPREAAVATGDAVTYDVVVSGATDGVGVYTAEVAVSDPEVASIRNATRFGGGFGTVDVGGDNATVLLGAFGASLDGPTATVGTVTLSGDAVGRTDLRLTSVRAAPGSDSEYAVDAVENATLTVGDRQPVSMGVDPANATVEAGANRTVDVVARNVTAGVGGFDLRVNSSDVDAARIVDAELAAAGPLSTVDVDANGSSVRLRSDATLDANGSVTLATVTVRGVDAGASTLPVAVTTIGDRDGQAYVATTGAPARVTVTAPSDPSAPTLEGAAGPAGDVDGDGLLEDVDGDGSFGFLDVVLLLDRFDGATVAANADAFDFDGSGSPNFLDVVALLDEL